jgi:hypothetical protein
MRCGGVTPDIVRRVSSLSEAFFRVKPVGVMAAIAVSLALGACGPTFKGGDAIRPENAPPVKANHSMIRGDTTYSSAPRVTVQQPKFSIQVYPSYVCPGNRVPCRPDSVDVYFELLPSAPLNNFPTPGHARIVVADETVWSGSVVYGKRDLMGMPHWEPPYLFHVTVPTDQFVSIAKNDAMWFDFERYNFRLSDNAVASFRRMADELPR